MAEEWRMQILFGCMSVALMGVGVISVFCAGWAVLHSRENNDQSPPTTREIWFMRVVGVGAFLGGMYALYAIVTGMPGAEGPPLP